MDLNNDTTKRIFDKLENIQRQIKEIQNELIIESDDDELLKQIREEDDYRTLKEWGKEGLGFHLDVEKD